MRLPPGARAVLIATLVTAGCDGAVVTTGSGGASGVGGGDAAGTGAGSGTSTGGAAPTSHVIEVGLDVLGGGDPAGVVAAINARSGELVASYLGTELPVNVEVEDGSLVSYFTWSADAKYWQSYRVTPEVTRVVARIGSELDPGLCNVAPMHLLVDLPPVTGAVDYWVFTDDYGIGTASQPGTITMDVVDCDGTVELLATARNGNAIVAYELVSLPFEAGATVEVPLTLPQTERRAVEVQISGLEGATTAYFSADWRKPPGITPHESVNALTVDAPTGTVSWPTAFIEPAPDYGEPAFWLGANYPAGDACASYAGRFHHGWQSPVALGLGRLAEVRAAGTMSWELTGPGELGDWIRQTWAWGTAGNPDLAWSTFEDPARPPEELVLPELPALLPDDFVPTTVGPWLYAFEHQDFTAAQGYAASIASDVGSENESRGVTYDCLQP
jgi:hypothetical protein